MEMILFHQKIKNISMESKIKHLEFIQTTINRMANNSFLLKGWSITVIGALFAVSFKEITCLHFYFSLILICFFAVLDAYYLSKERLFIKLYNHTRKLENQDIDFSMSIEKYKTFFDWIKALSSSTIVLFYGGLIIAQFIIYYYL